MMDLNTSDLTNEPDNSEEEYDTFNADTFGDSEDVEYEWNDDQHKQMLEQLKRENNGSLECEDDAHNDETFGGDTLGDESSQWNELQHETLVASEKLESISLEKLQNSRSNIVQHHKLNDDIFEKKLAPAVLVDPSFKPSPPSSSPVVFRTLEEIENEMIAERSPRNIRREQDASANFFDTKLSNKHFSEMFPPNRMSRTEEIAKNRETFGDDLVDEHERMRSSSQAHPIAAAASNAGLMPHQAHGPGSSAFSSLKSMSGNVTHSSFNSRGRPQKLCGLMTEREVEWITNIHLTQLMCLNPFVDDYYNTVYLMKRDNIDRASDIQNGQATSLRSSEEIENGKRVGIFEASWLLKSQTYETLSHVETSDGSHLTHPPPSTKSDEVITSHPPPPLKDYCPVQPSKTLGRLQMASSKAPRKLLSVEVSKHNSQSPSSNIGEAEGATQPKLCLKEELMKIETVHLKCIDVDDCDKRLRSLPNNTPNHIVRELESSKNKVLLRLTNVFLSSTLLTRSHDFSTTAMSSQPLSSFDVHDVQRIVQFMMFSKGRKLLSRVCCLLFKTGACVSEQQQSELSGQSDQPGVVHLVSSVLQLIFMTVIRYNMRSFTHPSSPPLPTDKVWCSIFMSVIRMKSVQSRVMSIKMRSSSLSCRNFLDWLIFSCLSPLVSFDQWSNHSLSFTVCVVLLKTIECETLTLVRGEMFKGLESNVDKFEQDLIKLLYKMVFESDSMRCDRKGVKFPKLLTLVDLSQYFGSLLSKVGLLQKNDGLGVRFVKHSYTNEDDGWPTFQR